MYRKCNSMRVNNILTTCNNYIYICIKNNNNNNKNESFLVNIKPRIRISGITFL